MLLQPKWRYLQRTVPVVGSLMDPIEEALQEKFSPTLFGGEEIESDFRKILGRSVQHGYLGIPYPRFSAESTYNTSKEASWELLDSLLGGSAFNYVGHRACVYRGRMAARQEKMHVKLAEMARRK